MDEYDEGVDGGKMVGVMSRYHFFNLVRVGL